MARRVRHDPEKELVSMPFGDHLEELRTRLLRAVLVFLAVFLVALPFQKPLLNFVAGPHKKAMGRLMEIREARTLVDDLEKVGDALDVVNNVPGRGPAAFARWQGAQEAAAEYDLRSRNTSDPNMEFLLDKVKSLDLRVSEGERYFRLRSDLDDLARRIEAATGAGEVKAHMTEALEKAVALRARVGEWETGEAATGDVDWEPLDRTLTHVEGTRSRLARMETEDYDEPTLKTLRYTEAFFGYMKVCFLAGLMVGLPYFIIEMWFFIAVGLYHTERSSVFPFLPISMLMLLFGLVFGYLVLVPVGLGYLGSYGSPDIIEPSFTLKEYLSLVVALLLAMGIVFQLPLLMTFLVRANLVKVELFRKYRKICILGGVTLSAMLTPPDVVTQLLMAGPMVLLFEIGILASAWIERKKRKTPEDS